MTVALEFSLPVVLFVAAYVVLVYVRIRRPSPVAFGCILPKLCVVSSDEVQQYREMAEQKKPAGRRLRREARRKQIRVYRVFLHQMSWNTLLFQQAVRFEKTKIDPTQSALDYEPRQVLALELVSESAETRLELVKAKADLLIHAIFGLKINHQKLQALLGQYKHLEQEIIMLAGMAEDDCYQKMLVERLGLGGWGLIEGGGPSPA
jgi:hypothetical protein